MSPERPADPDFAAGRRRKAIQFLTTAEEIMDLAADAADTYVTLCVHAGIAAADTLCAHPLRRYISGDNHNEALTLRRVQADGPALAGDLNQLLALKTKAGYTHRPVSAQERTQAGRRARTLVDAARDLPL